jgi:two-component system sensor histidine kinase BaeS
MADQAHPVPEGVTGRRLHPTTRQPLGRMGRRLLVTILLVSLTTLGVLSIGTVVPHLLARRGHAEAVEVEWLLAATALAVLFALVTSYIASVRLTAPLEDFLRMTRRFAAGDHGARVPDSGREEIADLTHALNAAAEEVQRSELARQRFTDEIAHELRTPLAALQAGLEELRDGLAPADPAALAALHDQATRLGRIVEDLGQLSAAETLGLQLSLDEVDLGEVAALALASREGSMTAAGLLVERDLDGGVVVQGDPDRLHQVIGNLLANTLYCRPGDTVSVRVRKLRGWGVLEVADTGPGFAPGELAHAFDRGWRGPAAAGTEGSGLGLAIVRGLVLAQGGTVRLANRPEGGVLVRVTLPLAASTSG